MLAKGNTVLTAIHSVDVSEACFYEWMRIGEADERGQYHDLFVAVSRARAEAKRRLVARIVAAAEKDWKAAAWTLEKLFPAEYGVKAEVEPKKGNLGLTILYDTGGKTMEELLDFPIHPSMKQTTKEE